MGAHQHLGSLRVVVRVDTGAVMLAVNYDVFGKPTKVPNSGPWALDEIPFGFAGGLYDSATGLVRFGARDYDPETGRWTRKDPVRFAPRRGNLYAYVDGDPINRTDPHGFDWSTADTREECVAAVNAAAVSGGLLCLVVGLPFGEIPFVACFFVDVIVASVLMDTCEDYPPAPPDPDGCEP